MPRGAPLGKCLAGVVSSPNLEGALEAARHRQQPGIELPGRVIFAIVNRARREDGLSAVAGWRQQQLTFPTGGGTAPRRRPDSTRILQPAITADHESFMQKALELADQAEAAGEVPVGAVVVVEDQIVGSGANAPISTGDPTAHAEILALREAAKRLGTYRLNRATLYATMEPCAMCAGALVNARVDRLVFGTRDLRFGAVRSKFRLADSDLLNHQVEVVEGVLAEECLERLQRFFAARR